MRVCAGHAATLPPAIGVCLVVIYCCAVQTTETDALLLTGVFLLIGSIGFPIVIALCASERIRANRLIGFRSDQILASAAAWRDGHRAALPVVALTSATSLVLTFIALLVPVVPVQVGAQFLAAVALFGGGVLALTRANDAAEAADGTDSR